MWVAIDIQMKGRQFGLVKAIMPTSACVIMLRYVCVCMPGNTTWVCVRVCVPAGLCGQEKRMIIHVFEHVSVCTHKQVCCGFNTLWL